MCNISSFKNIYKSPKRCFVTTADWLNDNYCSGIRPCVLDFDAMIAPVASLLWFKLLAGGGGNFVGCLEISATDEKQRFVRIKKIQFIIDSL